MDTFEKLALFSSTKSRAKKLKRKRIDKDRKSREFDKEFEEFSDFLRKTYAPLLRMSEYGMDIVADNFFSARNHGTPLQTAKDFALFALMDSVRHKGEPSAKYYEMLKRYTGQSGE